MEFRFDIDNLLPNEISLVDNTLVIPGWKSSTRNRLEYQQLYELINVIGEASSFAQSLNRVITNASKLQNSDHLLYLLKENELQSGRTVLVGMLKVGRKKLFVLAADSSTKEVAPLCVLDFYIHESRQRRGYGRKLFDYMLKDQNTEPVHMAVDKPSEKFLKFLARHYGLIEEVPQVNNFVVYKGFFQEDRPVHEEEIALTQRVSRSNRSSRTTSPDRRDSATGSPKSITSTHFAGKPSRARGDNSIPSYSKYKQYEARDIYLDHNYRNTSYTASPLARTPYGYSPLTRTPRGYSPQRSQEATPQKELSRPDSLEDLTSIAPTPATTPNRPILASDKIPVKPFPTNEKITAKTTPANEKVAAKEFQANGQPETIDQVDMLNGKLDELKLQTPSGMATPGGGDKTGSWRDGISRNTDVLGEHFTYKKGSSGGVLGDDESVHGHLKFHHHSLW